MPVIAKGELTIKANGTLAVVLRDPNTSTVITSHITKKGVNKPIKDMMQFLVDSFDIKVEEKKSLHAPTKGTWSIKPKVKPVVPTPSEIENSTYMPTWYVLAKVSEYGSITCPGGKHNPKFIKQIGLKWYCTNGQHKPKNYKASKLSLSETIAKLEAFATVPKSKEKSYATELIEAKPKAGYIKITYDLCEGKGYACEHDDCGGGEDERHPAVWALTLPKSCWTYYNYLCDKHATDVAQKDLEYFKKAKYAKPGWTTDLETGVVTLANGGKMTPCGTGYVCEVQDYDDVVLVNTPCKFGKATYKVAGSKLPAPYQFVGWVCTHHALAIAKAS